MKEHTLTRSEDNLKEVKSIEVYHTNSRFKAFVFSCIYALVYRCKIEINKQKK